MQLLLYQLVLSLFNTFMYSAKAFKLVNNLKWGGGDKTKMIWNETAKLVASLGANGLNSLAWDFPLLSSTEDSQVFKQLREGEWKGLTTQLDYQAIGGLFMSDLIWASPLLLLLGTQLWPGH